MLHVVREFAVDTSRWHNDSTSIVLHGDYIIVRHGPITSSSLAPDHRPARTDYHPPVQLSDKRSNRIDPAMLDSCHPDHRERYEFAAPRVAGLNVLDVGCGPGYGTARLAQTARSVTGLDPYAPAIAYAKAHYGADCRFVLGELHTAIPGCPFDAVVSMEAIEHVPDDAGFMADIHALLAPGGLLVISTPNADTTAPDGVLSDPTHLREFRPYELLELVQQAGFEILEQYGLHVSDAFWRRHAVRSQLGRIDRVGLRRFVPRAVKAWLLERVGKYDSASQATPEVTITAKLDGALSQILVAQRTL